MGSSPTEVAGTDEAITYPMLESLAYETWRMQVEKKFLYDMRIHGAVLVPWELVTDVTRPYTNLA